MSLQQDATKYVWMNGSLVPEGEARVGVGDAGLLHAAGVFTTMRAYGGRVFGFEAHLQRVRHSSEVLFVPLPYDDATLKRAATELLERNGLTDARLRLTVTRGASTRDPLHGEHHRPTVFLTAGELTPYPAEFYEKGLTVVLNTEQKLNPYDVQAGHKTLDYLSRFAGLKEAVRRGAGEAMWFSVHNFLQSASVANVFLVEEIDGRPTLVTPPTNADLREEAVKRSTPYDKSNVLPGVTRGAVIGLAGEIGVDVQRVPVDVNRLLGAREVFITNSAMGVMPVTRAEQHVYGDATPGEVTRRVMARYAEIVEATAKGEA